MAPTPPRIAARVSRIDWTDKSAWPILGVLITATAERMERKPSSRLHSLFSAGLAIMALEYESRPSWPSPVHSDDQIQNCRGTQARTSATVPLGRSLSHQYRRIHHHSLEHGKSVLLAPKELHHLLKSLLTLSTRQSQNSFRQKLAHDLFAGLERLPELRSPTPYKSTGSKPKYTTTAVLQRKRFVQTLVAWVHPLCYGVDT